MVGDADPREIGRLCRIEGSQSGREVNYPVLGVDEVVAKLRRRDSFVLEVLSRPVLALVGVEGVKRMTPVRFRPAQLARRLRRSA